MNSEFDIKLPYGFTDTYWINGNKAVLYMYDDEILFGSLVVTPSCGPISTTVYLRKHAKFYFSSRNKLHYLNDSLSMQVDTKISGESIHDIFDKFSVIRNDIILNNQTLLESYINILPISSIEQIINKANSVQLDSIMEAITKSSEINGEYVAMCLKRKLDLGYTDPKKELFL